MRRTIPTRKCKASVVDALAFRRADRHVAEVLQKASDETFDLIVRKDLVDEVDDEQVRKGLAAARKRQAAEKNIGSMIGLRAIVYARGSEDRSAELTDIVSTMEYRASEQDAEVN